MIPSPSPFVKIQIVGGNYMLTICQLRGSYLSSQLRATVPIWIKILESADCNTETTVSEFHTILVSESDIPNKAKFAQVFFS